MHWLPGRGYAWPCGRHGNRVKAQVKLGSQGLARKRQCGRVEQHRSPPSAEGGDLDQSRLPPGASLHPRAPSLAGSYTQAQNQVQKAQCGESADSLDTAEAGSGPGQGARPRGPRPRTGCPLTHGQVQGGERTVDVWKVAQAIQTGTHSCRIGGRCAAEARSIYSGVGPQHREIRVTNSSPDHHSLRCLRCRNDCHPAFRMASCSCLSRRNSFSARSRSSLRGKLTIGSFTV